ncbi:heme-degrading domain-containing protein [Subtercola boreus]|uniref:Uncharacterized protein n=1 Tax=Subtercola boreus TaxID=120213 RepID=A0A3E0WBZ2_9MICO|nr:heme-degrading domain-containing protein [Subtercola boreus]RFA20231.1 hypothetical protein B7R24_09460 [Subtercola boreus]RFA20383.1 hypothetical protein B7R23_09395 [Subtercola boreus]RFA26635.1 hypothetical protein B7R25_09525 [Subtercola boreus]
MPPSDSAPSRDSAILAEAERLDRLREREQALQFDSFDHADAFSLGSHLRDAAIERELPIAIAIVFGEQRVFHAGMPGASSDNDHWLERKFRVVRRFGESSYVVGTLFRSRGTTFEASARLDPIVFAAHGGAVPIFVHGSLIGIVGVSGLAQADDHELVLDALEWLRGQQ